MKGKRLGCCLVGLVLLGGSVGADDRTAAVLGAAEAGDVVSQHLLGGMYSFGDGVAQDDEKAVYWFHKAAVRGIADAQVALGAMYSSGRGIAQDHAKAADWYRQAAEQGQASAQHFLGECYEGGIGVSENTVEAARWYRLASEQGIGDSQYRLGLLYALGDGVPKSDVEAYAWLSVSAMRASGAKHDENAPFVDMGIAQRAKMFKDFIATRMTPAQLVEGEALARGYWNSYGPGHVEN